MITRSAEYHRTDDQTGNYQLKFHPPRNDNGTRRLSSRIINTRIAFAIYRGFSNFQNKSAVVVRECGFRTRYGRSQQVVMPERLPPYCLVAGLLVSHRCFHSRVTTVLLQPKVEQLLGTPRPMSSSLSQSTLGVNSAGKYTVLFPGTYGGDKMHTSRSDLTRFTVRRSAETTTTTTKQLLGGV